MNLLTNNCSYWLFQMMSEFERMGVKPPTHVATAVTALDTWTLLTGR